MLWCSIGSSERQAHDVRAGAEGTRRPGGERAHGGGREERVAVALRPLLPVAERTSPHSGQAAGQPRPAYANRLLLSTVATVALTSTFNATMPIFVCSLRFSLLFSVLCAKANARSVSRSAACPLRVPPTPNPNRSHCPLQLPPTSRRSSRSPSPERHVAALATFFALPRALRETCEQLSTVTSLSTYSRSTFALHATLLQAFLHKH